MSAAEHEEVHRDLGVYVLGALEPADRDRLERHLVDCDTCRDELASLAVLPSLLRRAGEDAVAIPRPPPLAPVLERISEDRRRTRRRTRVAAAAAIAAMLAAVTLLVWPLGDADPGQPYTSDVAGVTASVEERSWGMTVQITAEQLPEHDGFTAVAVARDGHRTQVASWTATGRPVTVDGACYLKPSGVTRMEILAAPGEKVVAVLRPET